MLWEELYATEEDSAISMIQSPSFSRHTPKVLFIDGRQITAMLVQMIIGGVINLKYLYLDNLSLHFMQLCSPNLRGELSHLTRNSLVRCPKESFSRDRTRLSQLRKLRRQRRTLVQPSSHFETSFFHRLR